MTQTKTIGRPTDYNQKIADEICEMLSCTNATVKSIGLTPGLPDKATIFRWIAKYPAFRDMYMIARGFQTELMYDDMYELANAPLTHNMRPEDDPEDPGRPLEPGAAMAEMQRRKLLIDVIKFKLVKLQPKRFGDTSNLNVDVNHNHKISSEQFNQLLATAAAPPQIAAPDDEADDNEGYIEFTETKDVDSDDMAGITADRFDALIDDDLG